MTDIPIHLLPKFEDLPILCPGNTYNANGVLVVMMPNERGNLEAVPYESIKDTVYNIQIDEDPDSKTLKEALVEAGIGITFVDCTLEEEE